MFVGAAMRESLSVPVQPFLFGPKAGVRPSGQQPYLVVEQVPVSEGSLDLWE